MIPSLNKLNEFAIINDKANCLQLPITVSTDHASELTCRFESYVSLLNEYHQSNINDQIQKVVGFLEIIQNSILSIHTSGIEKQNVFYQILDELDKEYNLFSTKIVTEIPKGQLLWRSRCNHNELTNVSEFYHTPFKKDDETIVSEFGNYRFSDKSMAVWYLGYTDYVCTREGQLWNLNNGDICSIAELKYIGEKPLRVIDLTLQNIMWNRDKGPEIYLIWWIIACSYCKSSNKEKDYIIPQLLSHYIRDNYLVDGIRYYTVRDVDLNPLAETCVNLALFTKYQGDKYDMNLCKNFELTGRMEYIKTRKI